MTYAMRVGRHRLTSNFRPRTRFRLLWVSLSGPDLWLDGDSARLRWAVDNLLNNAYHYTPGGGRVEIRLFEEQHGTRLDVVDNGVGVAVVDQPYLFTPFFRANNNEATFNVAGVGLGLFITRSIIESHGGRVWAESNLGIGSTFSLVLPVLKS